MKVDLSLFEAWENLNSAAASELKISSESGIVRCYAGLASAVYEISMGSAQFYSHKRSIALVKGATPHNLSFLPYFYKEGYEVQIAPEKFNAKDWVESLKKDTCFVIFPEDHAVTGEIFDTAELEKLLNEKKIFCLKISHSNHLFRKETPQPYSVRICSYDPRTAIAVLGARFKSPALMSSSMDWEKEVFLNSLHQVVSQSQEKPELVKKFESNLPQGFSAFLQTSNRCFDRSLIFSEDVAGESLQQYLASQMHLKLQKPGWEHNIETTHLCRWGGTKNYDEWWNPRPAESILRGLLILGTQVLEHPDIKSLLQKALRECQIADFS